MAYVKLALDLEILGAEGLRSKQIEGVQYRIFFCVEKGCAWLLHVIEKKSAKTPLEDIRLARKRMEGVIR